MPYAKQHKQNTRKHILASAFTLFTAKGFDKVTVDQLMRNCNLTRGGFYAHFTSKAELYSEAIKFSAQNSMLNDLKPADISDKQWVQWLLDKYLSMDHVNGERACPLAFLSTDIVMQNEAAKMVYADTYLNFNRLLSVMVRKYCECSEETILATTAMMIGGVAMARTLQNQQASQQLLSACRNEACLKLGLKN
jgi:AcrR family transcriptional regulator